MSIASTLSSGCAVVFETVCGPISNYDTDIEGHLRAGRGKPRPSPLSSSDFWRKLPTTEYLGALIRAAGHRGRVVHRGLLEVVLKLFSGNSIPQVGRHENLGYRKLWAPGYRIDRATAFEAHLLGVWHAGSYPFAGHGLGCSYIVFDIDDHSAPTEHGASNSLPRLRKLLAVLRGVDLESVVATSMGGRGFHVYVFLDMSIAPDIAHRAGKAIVAAAGITECEVRPSAHHPKGLGAAHALPLHPFDWWFETGGDLHDARLQPVGRDRRDGVPGRDPQAILEYLEYVHAHRNSWRRVHELANESGLLERVTCQVGPLIACDPAREWNDRKILLAMEKRHPQFRKALNTRASSWPGARSARELTLARLMMRQGVSKEGTVEAILALGGKAAERRNDVAYLEALTEFGPSKGLALEGLAGTQVQLPQWCDYDKPSTYEQPVPHLQQASSSPTGRWRRVGRSSGEAPWVDRVAPPKSYVLVVGEDLGQEVANPWWSEGVQEQLRSSRNRKVDGPVLAFVIDAWFGGDAAWHSRQQVFLSRATASAALGMNEKTVERSFKRIAAEFPEVVRMVPGVRHPFLRVAAAFMVLGVPSLDLIDWFDVGEVRSDVVHRDLKPENIILAKPELGYEYELRAVERELADLGANPPAPEHQADGKRRISKGCTRSWEKKLDRLHLKKSWLCAAIARESLCLRTSPTSGIISPSGDPLDDVDEDEGALWWDGCARAGDDAPADGGVASWSADAREEGVHGSPGHAGQVLVRA